MQPTQIKVQDSTCADFLRESLHQFVIKEPSFPDPKEALMIGFVNAEKKFMELYQNEYGIIDKSWSCAIVALIVKDMCYIANVEDSRAIMSSDQGQKIIELSRDRKLNDDLERKRIIEGGGQIYHRTATTNVDAKDPSKKEIVVGHLRELPGRLSVSMTFGDAEAKIQKFGGNPNVVIATPEIKAFRISSEHDFIVLGCDGIFDKLSNQDTIACVWNSVEDNKQLGFAQNIHKQSGMAVEYILKNSLLRRTLDNVTIVMIAFNNFKHTVFGQTKGKQQLKSKFVKGNSQSNHRSNENSLKNNLGINTDTNCTTQGPATTTNALLQRDGGKGIINGTISFLSIMPNEMIHQHLQQLQVIILTKDNDIRFLSQRIQMLEQELLKRTQEQSSSTSTNQGNISNKETLELLTKERANNTQLQDQTLQASQSAKSYQEFLTLANEQFRKKDRTLIELEKKQEVFEGKNQENMIKNDLLIAQKQLSESLKKISMLRDTKLQ
eukprot:403343516